MPYRPAPCVNNRARAGKEIIKCEPRQIGFTQVPSDPMEVCRNQTSRYEPAVCDAGIALRIQSKRLSCRVSPSAAFHFASNQSKPYRVLDSTVAGATKKNSSTVG